MYFKIHFNNIILRQKKYIPNTETLAQLNLLQKFVISEFLHTQILTL